MSRIIIITPPPPPPGSGLTAELTGESSRNVDAVNYVEGETALRLIRDALATGARIRIIDTNE